MQTVDISERWRDVGLPDQITDLLRHCKSLLFSQPRRSPLAGLRRSGRGTVRGGLRSSGARQSGGSHRCQMQERSGRQLRRTLYADRDPECSVIGDARATDKPSFQDRFGKPFAPLRDETLQWLKRQDLAVFAFILGGYDRSTGHGAMLIAPKNAGFFIGGLADLQEMIPPDQVPDNFRVRAAVYVVHHFGTRTSRASRSSCITERKACMRCFRTTCTQGRARRRASTECSLRLARTRNG